DQLSHKFLFLAQALLYFNALRNINDCALYPNYLAEGIANCKTGSQAMNFVSILPAKVDIYVLHRSLINDAADQYIPLVRIAIHVSKIFFFKCFLVFETHHADQSRICIKQFSVRISEENALAQRFEKVGKVDFRVMLRGNVPGPSADRPSTFLFLDQL